MIKDEELWLRALQEITEGQLVDLADKDGIIMFDIRNMIKAFVM
jgi:hypothetical protein